MTATPPPRPVIGLLPSELTSFIGRRREHAEIKRLLGRHRLVTLTGAGGVGKTRLALRVAAGLRRAFRDGVWFVELAQLRDPALLVHTVARALGFLPAADRPRDEALGQHLGTKRLLLVLDNCEHLADACAELADVLLRTCPGLRILTTSRESLRADGEAMFTVPPLPVPGEEERQAHRPDDDAVALFVERARSVHPGFALTDANRAAVAEICRRLDGIPLAIELAAVKVRALSAAEILAYLAEPRHVLRHDGRRASDRQRTLRACVDWSFALCSVDERRLWARLSVFAGGFEVDSAEGVCSDGEFGEPLLDLIVSLVDKSILIREEHDGHARFRMLEMIRQYGQDQLQDSGEWEVLRRRHRDWYAALAAGAEADWIGPRQAAWMNQLRRDHANLQVALDFCATRDGETAEGLRLAMSLRYYWLACGLLAEGRDWIDRFLGHRAHSPLSRIGALHCGAWLATLQGDLSAGGRLLDQATGLVPQTRHSATTALVTQLTALGELYASRFSKSLHDLEEALHCFEEDRGLERRLETLILLTLGSALGPRPVEAVRHYQDCAAVVRTRGDSWFSSYAAWAFGIAVWRIGDPDGGIEVTREALKLKRGLPDTLGFTLCLESLAWMEAARGGHERAAVLLGAADRLWEPMGTSTVALPALFTFRRECETRARRALGHRAYETRLRRGARLHLEDACDYALGNSAFGKVAGPAKTEENIGRPLLRALEPEQRIAASLTRREHEVVGLLAQGLSNGEIAAELMISSRTAETHVQRILRKLGLTSRARVAAWAAEHLASESAMR